MHVWADTFKRAARGLSEAERATLNAPVDRPHVAAANSVLSSDREGMMEIFGVPQAASGIHVSPDSAMRHSAAYRCTSLIAGAIASLPLPVYRLQDDGSRQAVRDHPLWWLLNEQPTPRFSAATFWEFVTGTMLLRGDGIAPMVKNRAGEVIEIIPVPSANVVPTRMGNRNVYAIVDVFGDGKLVGFDQDDVLHFPGFGFDGLRSMSAVKWGARNAIGTGIATEEYAGRFFANGATPKFYITKPGDMDEKQLDQLREAWAQKYAGAENSHKPLILWGDMKAESISLSAEDSQLLESRRFQVEDIARAFGVPPHMIGATDKTTSWGSGVEHMGQGFLTYTLQPHLKRFQQEINRKIFRISRYFVEFNTNGLLQADALARAKFLREARGGSQGPGYMSLNEIRRVENLPPVADGDEIFVPKTGDLKEPKKDDDKGEGNAE